jgi:hypothetical protein
VAEMQFELPRTDDTRRGNYYCVIMHVDIGNWSENHNLNVA